MKRVFTKARYLLALVCMVLLGTNAIVAQTETKFSFDTENDLTENFNVAKTGSATYKTVLAEDETSSMSGSTGGYFYTELGGTKTSTCTLSTKKPIENIENLSFLLASSDGKKTFLTIQISPKSDFSSDVTTITDALIMRPTGTEANCGLTTNSKFQQVSFDVESKSGYIKFIFSQGSNQNKNCGIDELVVKTRDLSAPIILAADDASIKATQSGVPTSVDIDVTGSNLTGSTLTATLSPAVEGLSVKLDKTTITNGGISAKATITYQATENVKKGTTTLILSDGTTEKKVTISYQAVVRAWELQTVTEAKTWDFTKLTANTNSERYGNNGIQLKDTTTPALSDEVVYENYNGGDITIGSEFDGTALAFKGEYPVRGNGYCQNGILRFNTKYPGYITVKFSDTGSSASPTAVKRYLVVNDVQTEYWASRPNNSTDGGGYEERKNVEAIDIYVPAGDVTVTGSSAIQVSKLSFTPATTYVDVSDKLYRTFASSSALDFTEGVEGLTAYAAVVEGDNVKFEPITDKVPAKTGMLLKADAPGRYIIVKALDEPTPMENNVFVGVAGGTATADKGSFVLYDGKQGLGFYKTTTESFTVGANTAYIPANVVSEARTFISLDGETTGIDAAIVNNDKQTNDVYNLNGQRVAQPTKGLYIVNGKKVIIK